LRWTFLESAYFGHGEPRSHRRAFQLKEDAKGVTFTSPTTETRIDSTDGVLGDRLLQSSRLLPHQFLGILVFSKPAGEADNPPHSVIFVWQTITGVT
jgi:hypothetical protein